MIFPLLSVLLGTYLCTPMSTAHSNAISVENLNATEDDNSTSTETEDDNSTSTEEQCRLVEDCDFFAWFIDNGNYGIPGFDKKTVDGLLKEDSCEENQSGDVLKVYCPVEGLDADDGNGTRTVTGTADLEECQKADAIGTIKITHADKNDLAKGLSSFILPTEKKPKQADYPNLARGNPILKTNTIIHYEATGICFCWEFYDKTRFGGKKQLVWPGDRIAPDVQGVSVKKVKCPADDEYDY